MNPTAITAILSQPTGPRQESGAAIGCRGGAADLCLIPARPSPADIETSAQPLDGKSADEIRGLWQWVASRLTSVQAAETNPGLYAVAAPANGQTELRAAG